jgi:hypothetical protein
LVLVFLHPGGEFRIGRVKGPPAVRFQAGDTAGESEAEGEGLNVRPRALHFKEVKAFMIISFGKKL